MIPVEVADIAVFSSDGKLQLIVEVKAKTGATVDWATKMHQNLLAYSAIARVPFFLLAMPDHFYLWKHTPSLTEMAPPDYEIDATPILSAYIENTNLSPQNISGSSLELIISSWLGHLIHYRLTKETAPPELAWFLDSGLYDAIKKGSVQAAT